MGELRGAKAELLAGLIWAERLWRRGSTAGLRLAGVRWSGGGVPGCLGRERARGRGKWNEGSFLELRRAHEIAVRGAAAGSGHGGGEVAAARSFGGGVAKEGEVQREGRGRRGAGARRVDASAKQRRSWSWPGATQRGGGRRGAVGGEREQRGRDRGRGKGIYLQFPKFPGT